MDNDNSERTQKDRFNSIADDYETHYDDKHSRIYRDRFMNRPTLRGLEMQGKNILEALCGSGQTTKYILDRGGKVTGLDISEKLMESFRVKYPTAEAVCASALDTGLPAETFDIVVVMMGLHHLPPHVAEGVNEMWRILKPGGYFVFCEPHQGSLPDIMRRKWYSRDKKTFGDNEEAVDVERLKNEFADKFDFVGEKYGGSLAYLLVVNSRIFRMPRFLKALYSPALIFMERIINLFQGKKLSCFVACQWRKK